MSSTAERHTLRKVLAEGYSYFLESSEFYPSALGKANGYLYSALDVIERLVRDLEQASTDSIEVNVAKEFMGRVKSFLENESSWEMVQKKQSPSK